MFPLILSSVFVCGLWIWESRCEGMCLCVYVLRYSGLRGKLVFFFFSFKVTSKTKDTFKGKLHWIENPIAIGFENHITFYAEQYFVQIAADNHKVGCYIRDLTIHKGMIYIGQ